MRLFVFKVLFVWLMYSSAYASGVDKLFEKEKGNSNWGDRLEELVGYNGISKSYALVVGISGYDNFRNLPTQDDAIRVFNYLIYESDFDYVHLLTEEKATKDRINKLMLEEFPKKIDKNDRFLFYWSGHGVQRENAVGGMEGYLPLKTSDKSGYSNMINMGDISHWDSLLESNHALYLIDACLSGLAGTASKGQLDQKDISQMLLPAHFLMSAGTEKEEVIASDRWGGSLFTFAFLEAIRGEADVSTDRFPRDGIVSTYEIQNYVKKRVDIERKTMGYQNTITPMLRDLRFSNGEYFFIPKDSINNYISGKQLKKGDVSQKGEAENVPNRSMQDYSKRMIDRTRSEDPSSPCRLEFGGECLEFRN